MTGPTNTAYFGLMTSTWDLIRPGQEDWPDRFLFQEVIERYREPALDVGCATGRLLVPYLEAGLDVEGVGACRSGRSPSRSLPATTRTTPAARVAPIGIRCSLFVAIPLVQHAREPIRLPLGVEVHETAAGEQAEDHEEADRRAHPGWPGKASAGAGIRLTVVAKRLEGAWSGHDCLLVLGEGASPEREWRRSRNRTGPARPPPQLHGAAVDGTTA